MKLNNIHGFLIASIIYCVSLPAHAILLSSSEYDLTDISGGWYKGSTGWNLGVTPVSLFEADTVLSDGYVDDFSQTVFNGIFATTDAPQSLVFGTTGGIDVTLNSFSFITTRNYGNNSIMSLDYRLDGGSWINAVVMTSNDLIAPLSTCLSTSANHCEGKTAIMDFGGVLADEWRWTHNSGYQVSLHEVIIDVQSAASVPEPSILALIGLGLAGFGFSRKRKSDTDS